MSAKKLCFVVIVVALILGAGFYLGLRDPYPPGTIVKLIAQVAPNEWLAISNLEAKVIDYSTIALPTSKKVSEDNTRAVVQWRCLVRNIYIVKGQTPPKGDIFDQVARENSAIPRNQSSPVKPFDPETAGVPSIGYTVLAPDVRCSLKIEFTDKDGFVLAETSFDSNNGTGDIVDGQTKSIYGDVWIPRSRIKQLAACKITPAALKTDAQLAEERVQAAQADFARRKTETERIDAELAQRREEKAREYEAKRQAEQVEKESRAAEREQRLTEERAKWKRLVKGMSQAQVFQILGEPVKTTASYRLLSWFYKSDAGAYYVPKVTFSDSTLYSWDPP
ncbi:MAG: hypothetical protein NTV49_05225 [Kiritimatiellaeota bacterium]|nr:hypothetical protein [Kiritimatiellota bacterium]